MTDPTPKLHTEITYLKGVGPKRAELFAKLGVQTVGDLLYHFPRRYLDRSQILPIEKARPGEAVTLIGKVVTFGVVNPRRGVSIFTLIIQDETDYIHCKWFNQDYLKNVFKAQQEVVVSGEVTLFRGEKQLASPEYEIIADADDPETIHTGRIVPLYPATAGLHQKAIRQAVKKALDTYLPEVTETLPDWLLKRYELYDLRTAILQTHFPESDPQRDLAHRRLAFEELFYFQLMLALRKRLSGAPEKGIALPDPETQNAGVQNFNFAKDDVSESKNKFLHSDKSEEESKNKFLHSRLIAGLPFQLTGAQQRAMAEIGQDLAANVSMNRMLHGDVGAGKTLVAVVAMLRAVENGYQAALMAPTEILAEQHARKIVAYLEPLHVNCTFLVGKMKAKRKREALADIQTGMTHIVIGTHALIQEQVQFNRLGLVVIDEQHRFGVLQRATLREKGDNPNVLVMTATPIPRTLAMTLYGDLDVSVLDELPAGRQPIVTKWTTESKRPEVYQFLRREIEKGRQIYVVYPLIEESEKLDLKAATEMYETLQSGPFKDVKVGLLHGRMKNDEKDAVMQAFVSGEIKILVSTTVIEVGVDVANATVMLIEHADRFGLTQLHQLRGRVGRGLYKSFCVLMASPNLSKEAQERLDIIQSTTDGFKIAEEDLRLRGPGEFFGTRQHGLPELRVADLFKDQHLLQDARKEAFNIIAKDPDLRHSAVQIIKHVLETKYREKYELARVG